MEYKPLSINYISQKLIPVFMEFEVSKAAVFGSCARGEMCRGSDVDVLVDIGNRASGLVFIDLKRKLESVLRRKVDLISFKSLDYSNIKNEILSDAKVIYEKRHHNST